MQRNNRANGGTRNNGTRASLADLPASASSSFARSLAQGGDFSHLLYADEGNDRTGDRRPRNLPQHAPSRHNAEVGFNRDNNRGEFAQNRASGGHRERHTHQNNYSSPTRPSSEENSSRRHSLQEPPYRGTHRSNFVPTSNDRRERRSSQHYSNPPVQSVRVPDRESLKTHEGKAPASISTTEPRESKPRFRNLYASPSNILPTRNSLSKGDVLDPRNERIWTCKPCGTSTKVLKICSLIRCNECGAATHNDSR